MSWALVLTAAPDELELLAARLFEQGALGVELQEPEQQLMPGTPPLPPGAGRCIAHFTERDVAADSARELGRAEAPVEVVEEDWSVAWRKHHRPLRVGPRSWVQPPWEDAPAAPGEARVLIDPGMAFGTGSHPTTALCLERLDELLAELPGADVLDVGTGSGVIALLAVKLGAGRVCGTENDPVALEAARRGAGLNGIPSERMRWALADPDQLPEAPYRIVVANILLNTLIELAPAIARKVASGGRLVLSGLLAAQADEAEAAYAALGLSPAGRAQRDGWARVELSRG
ncbi:MAG: 50S ribosomal protein L11 methyltransferase [Deltaproteobacteria bacterium]|nr:MAG: 50S ribosomal protein L11 methyltransferase [Deltaproteobacteria bacterium]